MPKYFFHSTDGSVNFDNKGSLHKNDRAAIVKAIVLTGEMLCDAPQHLDNGGELRVEVLDTRGKLIHTVIARSIVAPISVKIQEI